MSEVRIRGAERSDSAAIAQIYNHYVLNAVATFEEQPVNDGEMAERISTIINARLPWLVAERAGDIAGYCYAGPWKGRSAYRNSVEIAVYIAAGHTGTGMGSGLYSELFGILRKRSIHSVAAGIALPNPGCIALHEKFGLSKVAHFNEVGFKFNRWIDVAYWQTLL